MISARVGRPMASRPWWLTRPAFGGSRRVGPVVEQRAEVDQRLAERRHVPVEDRLHAVGVGRIELAVVELEVVVHERHPRRRRQGRGEPAAARCPSPAGRRRAGRGPSGCASPETWRSTKPSGRPSVVEVGGGRVEQVQVGHRVDEGERDAAADVGVVGHRRRDVVADDLAARRSMTTKSEPMTAWSSQNR